ncbi:ParB/RepB/Spo0J family partition protein [uncultured Senegalimassilia sp.]|uniref:ParB/RepB/Spo0J family partition protein n=1 Tax=uncultured Senegalimassilia sp. TaxID=1714350 RepID=UPI0025F33491|nr:ParB/RepB/Spo0J family partition protein [uncultured Senegalimassilia sp.]
MARNGRGGLGRGLNSLLGGAYEEAIPQEEPQRVRVDAEQPQQSQPKPQPEREVIRETVPAQKSPEPRTAREAVPSSYEEQEPESIVENGVEVTIKGVAQRAARPAVQEVVERTVTSSVAAQNDGDAQSREVNEVDINSIAPNPDQPRTNFKREELEELSASIQKDGLLQPILVRPLEDGTYQIIAGERRWQASRLAGLQQVPIRVKEVSDDKALELALIENIQRSDLNPIEEAYGYRRMMERLNMTQAEVAQAMSKGRSTVANALRLLELPEEAQQLLFEEKITAGHARAILSIPTKEGRERLTRKLVEEKLSVREAEALARLFSGKKNENAKTKTPMPKEYRKVARTLKDVLDTPVKVKSVNGKNKIEIEFKDEDDLERLFKGILASNLA